jgi:hypothetical protein
VAVKYNVQAMPTFAVITAKGVELTKTGGSEAVVNEIYAKAASLK